MKTNEQKIKQEINKKVQEAEVNLKKMESRREFDIWLIANHGVPSFSEGLYFKEALHQIGIDLDSFEIVTSFSLHDFMGTMNRMNNEGLI